MATIDLAERVPISAQQIAQFCQENRIRKLSLFGSVLRDDFSADSDIDVLVVYEPDAPITLLDMVRQERELSELLHRKVDLLTAEDLSRHFRQEVVDNSCNLYGG